MDGYYYNTTKGWDIYSCGVVCIVLVWIGVYPREFGGLLNYFLRARFVPDCEVGSKITLLGYCEIFVDF